MSIQSGPVRLVSQAVKVIASRPTQFVATLRGYLLFWINSRLARILFSERAGYKLGKNVRIQKLKVLSAEAPNAKIQIGDHCVVYENAQLAAYGAGTLQIGERCVIGDVRIYARKNISIGSRVVFSWNVFLQDFTPHPLEPRLRGMQMHTMTEFFSPSIGYAPSGPRFAWEFPVDPISIGDDVWLGANTTVLPGVKIGKGSIVAAGAVVTRGDYPENSILAGNPARIVKTLDGSGAGS